MRSLDRWVGGRLADLPRVILESTLPPRGTSGLHLVGVPLGSTQFGFRPWTGEIKGQDRRYGSPRSSARITAAEAGEGQGPGLGAPTVAAIVFCSTSAVAPAQGVQATRSIGGPSHLPVRTRFPSWNRSWAREALWDPGTRREVVASQH